MAVTSALDLWLESAYVDADGEVVVEVAPGAVRAPRAALPAGRRAPIGARVCKSGGVSGWTCGTILAKNVTVRYHGGVTPGPRPWPDEGECLHDAR